MAAGMHREGSDLLLSPPTSAVYHSKKSTLGKALVGEVPEVLTSHELLGLLPQLGLAAWNATPQQA